VTSGWLKGQLPVGRCDRRRADAGGTFPQQPHMPPGGMSSPQTDDVCSSSEPMSDAPRATSSRSASTSPAQSWLQATHTQRLRDVRWPATARSAVRTSRPGFTTPIQQPSLPLSSNDATVRCRLAGLLAEEHERIDSGIYMARGATPGDDLNAKVVWGLIVQAAGRRLTLLSWHSSRRRLTWFTSRSSSAARSTTARDRGWARSRISLFDSEMTTTRP